MGVGHFMERGGSFKTNTCSPSCQFLFDLSHRDASHWSPSLLHLWMPHRSSTFSVPKLQSLLHSLELASGVVSEALR